MSLTFSTYFACLSIGIAVLLLFAVVRFIYREKYAQRFLKLPEARIELVLRYDRLYVKLFKMALWPALILSVLLPSVLFFFGHEPFLPSAVCMALFLIAIVQEYRFRKWFVNYLETKRFPQ